MIEEGKIFHTLEDRILNSCREVNLNDLDKKRMLRSFGSFVSRGGLPFQGEGYKVAVKINDMGFYYNFSGITDEVVDWITTKGKIKYFKLKSLTKDNESFDYIKGDQISQSDLSDYSKKIDKLLIEQFIKF